MSVPAFLNSLKWLPMFCLVTLLLFFLADQLLGILGFPADIPYPSAHNKNNIGYKKTNEFEHDFVTNDQGLRYRQLPLAKPENETRILLLGDSFTEGQGVDADETFAVFLEEYFDYGWDRSVRFINAGIAGAGPLVYWRVFINTGLKYDPDAVLICLFANDLSDMPESLTREELFLRFPPKQGLARWVHAVYPRIHTLVIKAIDGRARKRRKALGFVEIVSEYARAQGIDEGRIRQWQAALPAELVEATDREEFNGTLLSRGLLTSYYWSDALDIDTPRAKRKLRTLMLVLGEIVATARTKGLAAGLVYVPDALQYDGTVYGSWNPWIIGGTVVREHWLHETSEIQRRLAKWAESQEIPFLDLTAVYRDVVNTQPQLNWKLDGHWTAQGHQVAGKAIAAWIGENGVFDLLAPAMPAPQSSGK